MSDLISGNQSQVGTVLQEHIPGTLSRIDTDAIIGQDGTRLGIHLELLCCIFDYSCKRGIFWYFDTVMSHIDTIFRMNDKNYKNERNARGIE